MLNMIKDNYMNENELYRLGSELSSRLRGCAVMGGMSIFGAVYVAYVANENGLENEAAVEKYINDHFADTRKLFLNEIMAQSMEEVLELSRSVSKEKLVAFLYWFPYSPGRGEMERTPRFISDLAIKILGATKKDMVADFGSGAGDFILRAANSCKNIYGVEISSRPAEVAAIRAELFGDNAEVHIGDMFALDEKQKYDKVFSNYPFALRVPFLPQAGQDYVKKLDEKVPNLKKATSSDWIFNSLIIDHLKKNGKAVTISSNGSTWNSLDRSVREYFVKKGYVEAVISLPPRMFETTAIPTTMYVFSFGNRSIRMIDAKTICEQGRRQNILTEDNIGEICNLMTSDSEHSRVVDLDEIQDTDYILNPGRYLAEGVEIEEGVDFGGLMKRITRGAPLNAERLDALVSEDPTDTQYLMLANIQNGMITSDLPYLKEFDPKLEKYCIKSGNLLLSKNGAPFKTAIAEVEEGKKLIGNGNMFIIELDEERVNPYYLKAFFESDKGVSILKSIAVGSTLPNISAESLKSIKVPLPSMEKQLEIAQIYQAKQDEIKVLRLKLERAQSELKGIFEEVC